LGKALSLAGVNERCGRVARAAANSACGDFSTRAVAAARARFARWLRPDRPRGRDGGARSRLEKPNEAKSGSMMRRAMRVMMASAMSSEEAHAVLRLSGIGRERCHDRPRAQISADEYCARAVRRPGEAQDDALGDVAATLLRRRALLAPRRRFVIGFVVST